MKSDVQCNAGTKYAQGNAALFVIDFQQQCCQPSTCADISGSCLTGYIAKPLTTILGPLADYSTDCCTPILPSCGNTVPTLTPGVKYDCSLLSLLGIWKYDDTKADQAPSQDNCCKVSVPMIIHADIAHCNLAGRMIGSSGNPCLSRGSLSGSPIYE